MLLLLQSRSVPKLFILAEKNIVVNQSLEICLLLVKISLGARLGTYVLEIVENPYLCLLEDAVRITWSVLIRPKRRKGDVVKCLSHSSRLGVL